MSFVTNSNSYPTNANISSLGVGVDGGQQPYNNINTNINMVHPSSVHPSSSFANNQNIANTNASLSMAAASFANPFSLMNPPTAALLAHVDPSFDMAALLTNAMVQQHHMMGQQITMAGLPLSSTLSDNVQPSNTMAATTTTTNSAPLLNTNCNNGSVAGDQSQFICQPVSNTNNNNNTAAAGNITGNNDNNNLEPCKGGVVSGGEVANGGDVKQDYVGGTASPFYIGQIMTLEEFDNTANTYAAMMNYEHRREMSKKTRRNASHTNTYYKYVCCRAGKPPIKKEKEFSRPTRESYKRDVDITFLVNIP